ncbi:hypothetical protein HY633_01165 [Candidatus Uhrbacteria bacterium]|nr:hypothetical protein [Candidatus Uhrbacteria bacterium]
MKNQYFGDFGDYQKFSLLKALRDSGGFNIMVHWMKTRDDGGNDGNRVAYLHDPETWGAFDNDIYRFLQKRIASGQKDLSVFEKSEHAAGLLFAGDNIEKFEDRLRTFGEVRKEKTADLIFFDPDNGIEVKSTGTSNLRKYVLWNDIESIYDSGKSVLVYQHFPRKDRETVIRERLQEFDDRALRRVFAVRVKHSVYFLLAQKKHEKNIVAALDRYGTAWKHLVKIYQHAADSSA